MMKTLRFKWYVLMVNPMKHKIAREGLQMLKHPHLRQMISANDMVGDVKMKSSMIFIEALLSKDLKRRVLNIQTVYRFFPNNLDPCVIEDLQEFFIRFSVKSSEAVAKEEVDSKEIISESVKEEKTINIFEEGSEYPLGHLVFIKAGPLSGSYGYIKEVEVERGIIYVEVSIFGNLATTEVKISDAQLIK